MMISFFFTPDNPLLKNIPEGFIVKKSTIPNAGLGLFAKISFESGTKFGPYQFPQTKNINSSNETKIWKVYFKTENLYFVFTLQ